MIINDYNLRAIVDGIKDSDTGSRWVDMFVALGFKDVYDDLGLPDIGKPNGQRPSKKEYLRNRLSEINGQDRFSRFFELLLNKHPDLFQIIADNVRDDGYQVLYETDHYYLTGGLQAEKQTVRNESFFSSLEAETINCIEKARVSIHVAVAWFTNQKIADKLIKKYHDGLDVKVVSFHDHTNARFGVDLQDIPHKLIDGTRGGTMHDKFCVIDNQFVMTGSYNWSDKAENKNDENASIMYDYDRASDYSVEFRRLFNSKE